MLSVYMSIILILQLLMLQRELHYNRLYMDFRINLREFQRRS